MEKRDKRGNMEKRNMEKEGIWRKGTKFHAVTWQPIFRDAGQAAAQSYQCYVMRIYHKGFRCRSRLHTRTVFAEDDRLNIGVSSFQNSARSGWLGRGPLGAGPVPVGTNTTRNGDRTSSWPRPKFRYRLSHSGARACKEIWAVVKQQINEQSTDSSSSILPMSSSLVWFVSAAKTLQIHL